MKNQLVAQLTPVSVYLFGSFATGTQTEESDLDFYIVVEDGADDLADLTPYGVSIRYPNELFLEEKHAKEALRMSKEILEWVHPLVNGEKEE